MKAVEIDTKTVKVTETKGGLTAPVYFPGLNQARALAATSVMLCHIEQIKAWYAITPNCAMPGAGITLFFVLSAFLITYLLLQEQDRHDKVDIKKFYLRRMCRIWPLYYFVVFMAFFVLLPFWQAPPGYLGNLAEAIPNDYWAKLGLYVCFLPGLCAAIYPAVPFVSQCWTLGVEEQFYLFWPLFVVTFRRTLLWAGLAVIAAKSALLCLLSAWSQSAQMGNHSHTLANLKVFTEVVRQFDAEAFIIGGLAAWAIYRHPKLFHRWLLHPLSTIAILAIIGLSLQPNEVYHPPLLRVGFALLILVLSQRPVNFGFLSNFVDYLGRVSYGLYMYHWTVAIFVAQWLVSLHFPAALNNVGMYFLTMTLSTCVAAVSYRYLEEPFLRLKKKLAVVQTT